MKYGVSNKQAIEIIEKININHISKVRNEKPGASSYKIINILKTTIEKYEISKMSRYLYEKEYEGIIESLISTYTMYGLDELIQCINNLVTDDKQLEEFDYVCQTLINKLAYLVEGSQQGLMDLEMYKDSELRHDLIEEFDTNYNSYRTLRIYYVKQRSIFMNNIDETANKQVTCETSEQPVNNLIFIGDENSSSFEKDLEMIPNEFYDDVIRLLNNLKYNNLNYKNSRFFNGNNKLKNYKELRDDQLRIMYRNIFGNYYEIIGIFQKQSDNDIRNYIRLTSRFVNLNESQVASIFSSSQEIEKRIMIMLEENRRKGNR